MLLFVAALCAAAELHRDNTAASAKFKLPEDFYKTHGIDPTEIESRLTDGIMGDFGLGKPQHAYSFEDYLILVKHMTDWKEKLNDPQLQWEYTDWHGKKKAEHDERMKKHHPWEMFKTFARHRIGSWVVILFVLCGCVGCSFGVRELTRHKAKRYYDDSNRSPFRRGPVRSAKID